MSLIATCHCGATRIELPHAPTSATACNCTFCSKVGGLWAYYRPDEIRVLSATSDRIYAPSGINLHHFCGTCGVNTYGDSPDYSEADIPQEAPDGSLVQPDGWTIPEARRIGINVRLLDDFEIASLPIDNIDGRNLW